MLWLTLLLPTLVSAYYIRPFKVNLTQQFNAAKQLIDLTRLPNKLQFPGGSNTSFGIDINYVARLKKEWTSTFDWEAEQDILNSYPHFKVKIEGIDVHFIHLKSASKDAIPIILNHGWPGTFADFLPVIKPLTQLSKISSGKTVSFDVIVPSLPGFTFSSSPPQNWTVKDTGRIFNTLMTDILRYPKYALHGTDWGSAVGYSMYNDFNTTVRAAYLNFLPFQIPNFEQIATAGIKLSPIGRRLVQRGLDFFGHHFSYFTLQADQPNSIGFSLYDSPVGQLVWIGDFYHDFQDPIYTINSTVILTEVSLYYMTQSFASSVYIYAQNAGAFNSPYSKAQTDAPFLFSNFGYNIAYWPKEYVLNATNNLVYFKDHDHGSHFAGLDNPRGLIDDIRQIGDYFERS